MNGELPLSWAEWDRLDATAMACLVQRREVSPRELATQAREAIVRLDPELNAVVEVFDDVVNSPAKDGMDTDGPFHGVPCLMKDAISGMRGRLQECGAAFMAGHRIEEDAPLTSNFRAAGFNLIGRTALPPMGAATVTESLINGVSRNPWNREYTPGGSSGGSAAAVASGMVPIASASDGGGSTRSPAMICGLVGLKPTRGRLPLPPALGNELALHFGAEGVLTRTLRDQAAAYDVLARHRPGDSFMPIPEPLTAYAHEIDCDPGRLRIAFSVGKWGQEAELPAYIAASTRVVAALLDELGHDVEEIEGDDVTDWTTLWRGVESTWIGGARRWRGLAKARGHVLNEETIEPVFLRLVQAAETGFSSDDDLAHFANNGVFTRDFGRFFERYDLLLTPVDAGPTVRADAGSGFSPFDPCDTPEQAMDWMRGLIHDSRYLIPANETGHPALSIPTGSGANGLPIGVQLQGPWCREDRLFRVAGQLERARPDWFDRRPPLSTSSL